MDREQRKHGIDWAGIRRRVEEAAARVSGTAVSAREKEQVLRGRAAALAASPEITREVETLELLEFRLGQEPYGIEASFVREICAPAELTPVPCVPPFVLGIFSHRGAIVSVIDLRDLLGLPKAAPTEENRIVILAAGEMTFALVADSIRGLRKLPLSQLDPPFPTLVGIREKYLRGVGPDQLVVLDAARLITDEDIVVCDHVEGMNGVSTT